MATAKRKQEERADEMDETSDGDLEEDENMRDFNSMDSCNNNKTTSSASNYGLDVLTGHVTQ